MRLGASSLTLKEAANAVASREISALDLVSSSLETISEIDGKLNAFIAVMADSAIEEAERADRELEEGRLRGPLHGVPIAIKDIIDIEGYPTQCHSRVAPSIPVRKDAEVIARLRAAGAIIIGKTALHEFASGGPSFDLPWPPARNPWLTTHHPGGSSSGSAVAVSSGMVAGAIGTDTAGSVRHPATACGIVGLKPTYDVISRRGVFPLAFSLDHVGPLTRNVADCAVVYDAIRTRTQSTSSVSKERDLRGLRIGVLEEFGATAHPSIGSSFEVAKAVLMDLGAELVSLDIPPLEAFAGCGRLILQAESYAVHANWLRARPSEYGQRGRLRLSAGEAISAEHYIKAQQLRRLLTEQFTSAMSTVDAAICVSSLELPCAIDDAEQIDRTYDRQARTPFNLTGSPALALPIGFTDHGLPTGMQIVGRHHDEPVILRIAAAYEAATGWHMRRPEL